MNPPPLKARVLGHPIVFLPIFTATLGAVYAVILDRNALPILLLIAWLMNISLKANQQVAAYKSWKRAWDSMPPSAPPPRQRRPRPGLALVLVALIAGYLALTLDQPGHALGLGWMIAVGIVVSIALAVRALARRRKRSKAKAAATVSICVSKPFLPVPSLHDAYGALPPYCQRLMGGRA